jgi:hypothetical protein
VLVERHDLAEHEGREERVDQRRGGAVAREDAVAGLPVEFGPGQALLRHDRARLVQRAAAQQRLGLGEAVRDQQEVLVGEVGLVPFGAHHEFAGNTRVPWWISW